MSDWGRAPGFLVQRTMILDSDYLRRATEQSTQPILSSTIVVGEHAGTMCRCLGGIAEDRLPFMLSIGEWSGAMEWLLTQRKQ